MAHLSRLDKALLGLLKSRRVATLATINGASGAPYASLVPFAIDTKARQLVLHVSGLAAHTANMSSEPRVSLLISEAEPESAPVHDMARITLEGVAHVPAISTPAWQSAREAYLARFPEAEPMTTLTDFRFVCLELTHGRHIAGFGAARSVQAEVLNQILGHENY